WRKFLRPSEFVLGLGRNGFVATQIAGLVYDLQRGEWLLSSDLQCKYMIAGVRREIPPVKHRGASGPPRRHGVGIGHGAPVGGWDPGDPPKADPLVGEFMRLVFARFTIDAVRIDLAIMYAASLLGKAVTDVIAIGLDLPAHLD